jgi:hypothetical protein
MSEIPTMFALEIQPSALQVLTLTNVGVYSQHFKGDFVIIDTSDEKIRGLWERELAAAKEPFRRV